MYLNKHYIELRVAAPDEHSHEFLQGMLDRMGMSYHKYGPVRDGFPDKIDALKSMRDRVTKYNETGNTEFLIDAANFAMIEFMFPSIPGAHFKATDSQESPGRVTMDGDKTHAGNREL